MKKDICFAVDGMLGRLGKYMRVLGFDTLYDPSLRERIFSRCEAEDRILITQRRLIPDRFEGRVITVDEGPVEKQILTVFKSLRLVPSRDKVLTICLECNTKTEEVTLEDVIENVPDDVREKISSYKQCPACEKVFWWGSHADRMMQVLERSGVLDLLFKE